MLLTIGVALPLLFPRLLVLWFGLAQTVLAFVIFIYLPRRGAPLERPALLRWLMAASLGAVAVAWAVSHMS